mmetsp:Transcript_13363/g.26581  ORF Transcript_13363/g.26581 Transcript_13363/m.26581 type:complete len:118 (+) Transcript_13363:1215-1568(+)
MSRKKLLDTLVVHCFWFLLSLLHSVFSKLSVLPLRLAAERARRYRGELKFSETKVLCTNNLVRCRQRLCSLRNRQNAKFSLLREPLKKYVITFFAGLLDLLFLILNRLGSVKKPYFL